jgi:hypothetical protein
MREVIAPTETRSLGSRQKAREVLTAACDVASLGLLGYLLAARVFYAELQIDQAFGVDRMLVVVLVGCFVLLRRLAENLDPRLTLGAFTMLGVAGAGLVLLPAFGVNLVDRIRVVAQPFKEGLFSFVYRARRPAAIHRLDDRFGYVHVPNATDWERGRGFTATYTTDADGHRAIPIPATSRGRVVFLGDSMTFGWGVNDDEPYPYVLATKYWADLRIVNAGVDGWGLTQFYLALQGLLTSSPLPSAVVLAIVPDDLRRSHLRPPLVRGQRRRLEWIDGAFVSRDLHDGLTDLNQTPELAEEEARLARATIEAMIAEARGTDVAFGVVLLGDGGGGFPPDLIHALGRARVTTVDLTRLGHSTLPDGVHPDAEGHRTIAAAIAASPLADLVYEHEIGSASSR